MSIIVEHIKAIITLTSNERQKEFYKFLLKNGKVYTREIPYESKTKIYIEHKMCYSNALKTALYNDMGYVEGFYLTDIGVPLEHAFCNIDGNAHDPTTQAFKVGVKERFGVRVPAKIVMAYIMEKDETQIRFTCLQYYFMKQYKPSLKKKPMRVKMKLCKGFGPAKGHGCSNIVWECVHGLGKSCGCYSKWLLETKEGEEKLKRSRLKAQKIIQKQAVVKYKKKRKKDKDEATDWKKKLQTSINEIVRLIDKGQMCPAKKYHAKQFHAGHVYSRGAEPSLRYNLHNIHRQSAQSNHFQNEDGLFREGLSNEYGPTYMEFLSSLREIRALKYSQREYNTFYKKAREIALRLRKEDKTYTRQERLKIRNKFNIQLGIYPLKHCHYEYTNT